jgi:hypothetical protein
MLENSTVSTGSIPQAQVNGASRAVNGNGRSHHPTAAATDTSAVSLAVALKWPHEKRVELAVRRLLGVEVLRPTIANICAVFDVERSAVITALRRSGYFANPVTPLDRAWKRASPSQRAAWAGRQREGHPNDVRRPSLVAGHH